MEVVVLLTMLTSCTTFLVHAAVTCGSTEACFPWSTTSCTRGNNLNLRFYMNADKSYAGISPGPTVNFTDRTLTWAFCPRVDELQAFNLSRAPQYSSISPTDETMFVENMDDAYVSVFGFGMFLSREVVQNTSTSVVMVATNGSQYPQCKGSNGVLLADFLVFQISLTNGLVQYPGGLYPFGNESGVNVQPLGIGFQPTCSGGICQLDSSLACIGAAGNQNCATCYTNPHEITNRTVQIWVSYYGTDNNGRQLLSGSSNPLNFRQYSGSSVYGTLSSSLTRLQSGDILDPNLANPTFP